MTTMDDDARLMEQKYAEAGEIISRAEAGIRHGEKVFINERDRVRLRAELEAKGVNLEMYVTGEVIHEPSGRKYTLMQSNSGEDIQTADGVEKVTTLGASAAFLDGALGREMFVNLVGQMVVAQNWEGAGEKATNKNVVGQVGSESVFQFVKDYLNARLATKKRIGFAPGDRKYDEEKWKRETIYQCEAIIAVMHRLLLVVAVPEDPEQIRAMAVVLTYEKKDDDDKVFRSDKLTVIKDLPAKDLAEALAGDLQSDKYARWQMRERWLRGLELCGEDVPAEGEVKRYKKDPSLRPVAPKTLTHLLRALYT